MVRVLVDAIDGCFSAATAGGGRGASASRRGSARSNSPEDKADQAQVKMIVVSTKRPFLHSMFCTFRNISYLPSM